MGLEQKLPHPVRVSLGVMVLKTYSTTHPKFPELEPDHQKQFSDMQRILVFVGWGFISQQGIH